MATLSVNWELEVDWELINDDGFVCKRRKRPRLHPPSSPEATNPAVDEQKRRRRKKIALLKLKDKYQREIRQWVHLSNTFKELQQKSSIVSQQQKSRQINDASTLSAQVATTSPVPPGQRSDSACRQLVDELLLQAEAQRCIIEDVARVCDVAEGLYSAREESFTKSFTELPVWASNPPHELLRSLCDD